MEFFKAKQETETVQETPSLDREMFAVGMEPKGDGAYQVWIYKLNGDKVLGRTPFRNKDVRAVAEQNFKIAVSSEIFKK